MRLNLGAILHVTHAYLGAMVERRWGRVVTIVSDAGRKGERCQAIYGAAKAGAMGFIRGLAAEVGAARRDRQLRRRSATMRTGARPRPRSHATPSSSGGSRRAYTGAPPRRARPTSRRSSTLLCSDAGAWITGQVYPVDGGYVSAL